METNNNILTELAPDTAKNMEVLKAETPQIFNNIFTELLGNTTKTDFKKELYPDIFDSEALEKLKVKYSDFYVITIQKLLPELQKYQSDLLLQDGAIYYFNTEFWEKIDNETLKRFLSAYSKKIGVPPQIAKDYKFADCLEKQYLNTVNIPSQTANNQNICINFKNGTLEISNQNYNFRSFNKYDYLKYKLPFDYDKNAACPIFDKFLFEVLPNVSCQNVLAEFFSSCFIKNSNRPFKTEKCLILYGAGANGKSVLYEVITALLHTDYVSGYSLQELTEKEHYRFEIKDKLINFASELSNELKSDIFKKLASGEPLQAKQLYKQPITMIDYAKFAFNTNVLPKETEQTHAFFRRFLIIPFEVTIPESKQDKELHNKIIKDELPGVFNWILRGLDRYLTQKGFTYCNEAEQALKQYETESNSVALFISDCYDIDKEGKILGAEVYKNYRTYCIENGYKSVSNRIFFDRCRNLKINVYRANQNKVYLGVYLKSDF